jgi:hypothetical protein
LWQNLFLHPKFFCKHLHLVISQLLDEIFQPFKEQNWCPSLGAPNFGANLECFAQLLWFRSKTPNFGVTKNSVHSYTALDLLQVYQSKQSSISRILNPPGTVFSTVQHNAILSSAVSPRPVGKWQCSDPILSSQANLGVDETHN